MGMKYNMSEKIRRYKEEKNLSWEECSKALGVARSALQKYSEGKGNPTLGTVEYLAGKMGVEPIHLLCDSVPAEKLGLAMDLLGTLRYVGSLSGEKRALFVCLFLRLLELGEDAHEPTE